MKIRNKVILKLNIQKTKIMAFSPIPSWHVEGELMETGQGFIFLGSKITPDGDCSHEIKRCLLLRIKAMTILDSILKSRDITLPIKVHLVKTMVFPVVIYGCKLDNKKTDFIFVYGVRSVLVSFFYKWLTSFPSTTC